MTKVTLTLFNGKGNSKVPLSEYEEGYFIFTTQTYNNLKDAASLMFQNFVLSKSLDLPSTGVFKRRVIEDLKEYSTKYLNNIIIDLDEISTREDYFSVIEYFKEKDYSVILGKSSSFNNKDCYNIKGILRVEVTNSKEVLTSMLSQMQTELGDICKVDLTVANLVSLQAPSYNDFIIYYQEHGIVIKDSDIHIKEIKHVIDKPTMIYDNTIVDKSLEIFWSLGYSMINKNNDNDSINFTHPSEVKSKGGYFWYPSNPFVMNHHNKMRTISIFHLIKDTPEGKEFLKSKTKTEQKNQLIKTQNMNEYSKFLIVNERYLDFNKEDKISLVNEWLDSDKDVLKIKSAMGTAKSAGIDLAIKLSHERNKKVILVSNRVSVAKDFAEKYQEHKIVYYKDPGSEQSNLSLVVQYDSLFRFNLSKYDVVIFDEFASLLLHHRANLTSNNNINAIKFKILLENKKVIVADAFLTGYEDIFFKNRNILAISNEYRDDLELFEYTNKEFFISSIIGKSIELKDNEHISCSFTSLNVMRVVEMELKRRNIKAITLSSETSELTRELIYKRFKDSTHNAFKVILFTPTLTVGVSNLNNTPYHFHYDTGMSTDVISSLQMIKRSRTTKEIHFFITERQFYYDTDYNSLNSLAEKNINSYYINKDKTLLVDVDLNTGDLKLTDLAKYINRIEVFYNILENNHANSFKLLLNYQFESNIELIDTEDNSFTIREKVKEIKEQIKKDTIDILNKYSDVSWNPEEIQEIKNKTTDKSEEDIAKIIMGSIQEKFKHKIPSDKLILLSYKEIETDYKFISTIKNMRTFLNNNDHYAQYILSKAISSDISSLQNKSHLDFLEYIIEFNDKNILQSYSRNEIKNIDLKRNKGKKFEKFLKKIGYSWKDSKLRIIPEIFDYIEYL